MKITRHQCVIQLFCGLCAFNPSSGFIPPESPPTSWSQECYLGWKELRNVYRQHPYLSNFGLSSLTITNILSSEANALCGLIGAASVGTAAIHVFRRGFSVERKDRLEHKWYQLDALVRKPSPNWGKIWEHLSTDEYQGKENVIEQNTLILVQTLVMALDEGTRDKYLKLAQVLFNLGADRVKASEIIQAEFTLHILEANRNSEKIAVMDNKIRLISRWLKASEDSPE